MGLEHTVRFMVLITGSLGGIRQTMLPELRSISVFRTETDTNLGWKSAEGSHPWLMPFAVLAEKIL